MTRNLVICMVPTVLAFFAIYWLKRRKKKTKHVSDLLLSSVHEKQESEFSLKYASSESSFSLGCASSENKSSSECASSDLDNTLSDASSFTSPISSEKSSETDSPLFDSPLHIVDGCTNCSLMLPNCIENSCVSYASESKTFLRIEDLTNSVLTHSQQSFDSESLNFENSSETPQSSKLKTLQSPNVKKQNVDFFRNDDLFLSKAKRDDQSTNNKTLDFNGSFDNENNNPETYCLQKKVVDCEIDNLTCLITFDKEKADCHSSAFDENSLSYGSDDSEGKQCKNKGSLSSVLDENSLLSSFCDELEKSSASNSPIAITSKSIHFDNDSSDSSKDILNLLSFKEASINIQNYTNSYTESLKESNLDKHLEESSVHAINCADSLESYSIIFEKERLSFGSKAFIESNLDDLDVDLTSFIPKEDVKTVDSLNRELVQNNLSKVKELSLTSNDKLTSGSKTLNIDAALEKEQHSVENDIFPCSSSENGYNNSITSFIENKTATYASILNSNKNNSSSDAATCRVQPSSSTLNCNDSVNQLFKSSLNWPLLDSRATSVSSAADLCSASKSAFYASDEIPLSKRYCEIKINPDSAVAAVSLHKNSASLHQKDNLLESSSEEGLKVTKQSLLESNGILDQKTQSSKEFVYEFELPQELCGRLIGKHGRNVKNIMEHSNANVFIKHHPYEPSLKVVVVEGHRADVNEALEIIRRKYPPSMFPTVTLVQTNVLSSSGVPMPESLQLHLPEGASCDVILSSLVSAGHFFLQQPTHPTYPSLSTLDQCMINLYSQMDTPVLPRPIEAGVICAAPVYRGWYRAQVVYVCDNSGDCGIKFVDYGGFSQVPISSLRQIRSDFMSLPFQASECYLAQVRPLGGDSWSSEATSVFEELAQGQILQALLVEYADDGIPCVYLYRVQGVSSTFINKELVERGLAEWVGNSNHWDPH